MAYLSKISANPEIVIYRQLQVALLAAAGNATRGCR